MSEACKSCRYSFETKGIHLDTLACRRHAPLRDGGKDSYENDYGRGVFPRVSRTDWCGDWRKIGHVDRAAEPVTSQERMWYAFWNDWRRSPR